MQQKRIGSWPPTKSHSSSAKKMASVDPSSTHKKSMFFCSLRNVHFGAFASSEKPPSGFYEIMTLLLVHTPRSLRGQFCSGFVRHAITSLRKSRAHVAFPLNRSFVNFGGVAFGNLRGYHANSVTILAVIDHLPNIYCT